MSDATLEHFGNRIRGIGAFIQELPTSDSDKKKGLLGLLHEIRGDLLAISRMINRAIEGQGSVPEHSGAPEDPTEALAMLVKA